jgi:hypothetical protein
MAESSDSAIDTGALVSVIGGAMTLKSAIAKRQEAEIHAESLREVGASTEAEVVPHTIELENQVVRLEGTVDEQYDRLRTILRDLYFADLDLPVPPAADADPRANQGGQAPTSGEADDRADLEQVIDDLTP